MRVPLLAAAVVILLLERAVPVGSWGWLGFALLLVGFALYFRVGTVHAEPVPLVSPVRGRWVAVNSPATSVPSHGVQAYGQTHAVDLVHVPDGDWRPELGWSGPHARPPEEYAGFGQPVLAPADGVVAGTRSGRRDHDAHTSYLGLLVMFAQGSWLELTGRVLGNHVILEVGPDTYVALAHLRRGSVCVREGERVRAGQTVGECGNSGNTSEPHLHVQVMDRRRPALAAGLPMAFTDAASDDGSPLPMPTTGQAMHVVMR